MQRLVSVVVLLAASTGGFMSSRSRLAQRSPRRFAAKKPRPGQRGSARAKERLRKALEKEGAPEGPYALNLGIRDRRVVFAVTTEGGEPAAEFHLSLGPFRQTIKDYFAICEAYFDAVKRLPPSQIEAIDMGRRGIHNEGARILKERLEGKAAVDDDTSRRLFTLICVLHFKG